MKQPDTVNINEMQYTRVRKTSLQHQLSSDQQ